MKEANCGFDHASNGRELLVEIGPELKVDIGFDPYYVAAIGVAPVPGRKGLNALIDTGATECHIDSSLAVELALPNIDIQEVLTPIGRKNVAIYLAQIHVIALQVVVNGRFAALDMERSGLACTAILGRTFLQKFKLHYEGPTGLAKLIHPD